MARVRSPNYPSMSLPSAIDRVRQIQKAESRNAMTREVVAKHLGFGGINGASATAISAIVKFGLLDKIGEGEMRVSELAMKILFPHDEREKLDAIREAAAKPDLFAKISEKWPSHPPSDENLRAFLVRDGFAAGAVDQVIRIYRDTMEVAKPVAEARQEEHAGPSPRSSDLPPSETPARTEALPPLSAAISTGQNRPFTVSFDGETLSGTISIKSSKEIERLIRVLEAQKSAFEAMSGFDDEEL